MARVACLTMSGMSSSLTGVLFWSTYISYRSCPFLSIILLLTSRSRWVRSSGLGSDLRNSQALYGTKINARVSATPMAKDFIWIHVDCSVGNRFEGSGRGSVGGRIADSLIRRDGMVMNGKEIRGRCIEGRRTEGMVTRGTRSFWSWICPTRFVHETMRFLTRTSNHGRNG